MKKLSKKLLFVLIELKKVASSKKKILIFVLSLFLFFLVFLFFTFYGSWWRFWPQNIKASIAINRLAVSVYNNQDCRDFCYFEQLNYEKVIFESLNNKRIFNRLIRVIFNESDNLNWRLRVLDIILKSEIIDLEYFLGKAQEFIDNPNNSYQIKQVLILNFKINLDYAQYLDELKSEILDGNLNSLEIKESLSFLLILNELSSDLVLEILNKSSDISLVKDLVSKINSNNYHASLFDNDSRLEYSNILEKIFLKFNNYDLRSLIIFSLADFLSENLKEDYSSLLQKLYFHEESDKFSKFLIADILNSYSDKNYVYPEISQTEWNDYYNFSN
ncbi:MAG: hypothetical protein WC164_01405 [Patescibacteria group bacterium]|nr:hypothetical protein [Patescibacteria group bacterium]